MLKNLPLKLSLIVGITALAVLAFTPPSRKVRLGLDLHRDRAELEMDLRRENLLLHKPHGESLHSGDQILPVQEIVRFTPPLFGQPGGGFFCPVVRHEIFRL